MSRRERLTKAGQFINVVYWVQRQGGGGNGRGESI